MQFVLGFHPLCIALLDGKANGETIHAAVRRGFIEQERSHENPKASPSQDLFALLAQVLNNFKLSPSSYPQTRRGETIMRKALMFFVIALAIIPCLAQDPQNHKNCSLIGTWLGGSDPSGIPYYQMTITPEVDGRLLVAYQAMYDPGTHYTSWTGEAKKGKGKNYTEYALATYIITQAMADFYRSLGIQVDPGTFEADGIYTRARLLDCNTIQSTITWFGWYIPIMGDTVPFVTQPQIEFIRDFNGGQPIVEIYHRIGPDCPICGSAGQSVRSGMNKEALPKWRSR